MPQAPIEFKALEYRFRSTPLAAIPLVREHEKLLVRFDGESGALNTLAFTFEQTDFDEIAELGAAGVLKLVKLMSMLIGTDKTVASVDVVEEDDVEDAPPKPPPKPIDELPRTLVDMCLYYAKLGNIEQCIDAHGQERWLPLQSVDDFNAHPYTLAMYMCAVQVFGGLFAPFADLFPGLSAKAKAALSSKSTAMSAEAPATATAPTSEN